MGKSLPPIERRTRIDRLRDDLYRCESWLSWTGLAEGPAKAKNGSSDRGVAGDALALLRLLDRIAGELEELERAGADVRAEGEIFDLLLRRLRGHARAVVAQWGAEVVAQREPHARWWWYLEKQAAADRKRSLIRVGTLVLVGLILISGLYLLYERFLAPSPQVRQVQAHLSEGEQAAFERDFVRAIREFQAVVELDPGAGEAHLWLGALYQEQGKPVEASRAFEQARSYLGNGPGFLLQRGLLFLSLGDVDGAYNDATLAIQTFPERPEGHFLQGSVAEQVGDLELALAALQKADERAGAVGQQELQVTIRIRIGMILQQLGTQPQS